MCLPLQPLLPARAPHAVTAAPQDAQLGGSGADFGQRSAPHSPVYHSSGTCVTKSHARAVLDLPPLLVLGAPCTWAKDEAQYLGHPPPSCYVPEVEKALPSFLPRLPSKGPWALLPKSPHWVQTGW